MGDTYLIAIIIIFLNYNFLIIIKIVIQNIPILLLYCNVFHNNNLIYLMRIITITISIIILYNGTILIFMVVFSMLSSGKP